MKAKEKENEIVNTMFGNALFIGVTQEDVRNALKKMHEWDKEQFIEKACDAYCKDCEYIGCDKFECLALEKFKKAMEE